MNQGRCGQVVMIVDDDRDVRESIAEVLEDHAYRPLRAANGRDAIELLRTGPARPCLILLDIMMPIMDGWQFLSLQRADPEFSAIPVVVLTAHARVQEITDQGSAAACLEKPVELDALLAAVKRFCRRG